jgi:hypothetical protein
MVYTNTNKVEISKGYLRYLQQLLEINFEDTTQQDTIDDLCAVTDDYLPLFEFMFDNNTTITYDLCSGSSNYYDNVCIYSEDFEDCFDCDYTLDEKMIFEYGDDTYICNLTIV